MRAKPHLAAALTVVLTAYLAAQAAVAPASGNSPGNQETNTPDPSATPTGTPVVDPAPAPVPVHLPAALRHHDYKAPDPVVASAQGYLTPLSAEGRAGCAPGTHVLLERDDPGAAPVAVAYALRPDDISTALDLYMGSFVELIGIEELTPAACPLSVTVLGVDRVRILDHPGGGPPATAAP